VQTPLVHELLFPFRQKCKTENKTVKTLLIGLCLAGTSMFGIACDKEPDTPGEAMEEAGDDVEDAADDVDGGY
jgi:hypothetical protein